MYLDTSVLVTLFVREPESQFYGQLTDGQVVCTSALSYTELWSILLKKERRGELDAEGRRRAWAAFDRKVMEEVIELIPLGPAIVKRANRIMEKCHPQISLAALDTLHLASADQAQDWPLATADNQIRAAAELLGFPLTPPPVL
jgi:predicted nucleic acid-binding protein